jgi:hypothetical protein
MRPHLAGPNDEHVDQVTDLYSLRISGYLGPTALSAFPSMVAQLKDDDTLLTVFWIGLPCTACWRRSRRSVWTWSSFAACFRGAYKEREMTSSSPAPAATAWGAARGRGSAHPAS